MIPPTVNVGLHFDLLQLNNNKAVDTYQHEVKLNYLLGCSRIIRQIKCNKMHGLYSAIITYYMYYILTCIYCQR